MLFVSSAPCKVILFGEHYVVYGSPVLAIAIEPRNRVKFGRWEGAGVSLHSSYGTGVITRDGAYEGAEELEIYQAVANAVFPNGNVPSCKAEFLPSWKLKGVGASASFCAAFAAGLFRLAGKTPSTEEIFAAAQAGDLLAHGGRASGIDAKTVSFGESLIFQRSFEPPEFNSSPANFSLPAGTALFLIDTFRGEKDGTLKMLETFASQFGVSMTPSEVSGKKRLEIREEYAPVWKKIVGEMKNPDPKRLGRLMEENHALLRERKMSSEGIETAVSSALASGAHGAKLTGAGGEGGAVLVLCEESSQAGIARRISEQTGFACHPISLAKKGAAIE